MMWHHPSHTSPGSRMNESKVTLFIANKMNEPKQGILSHTDGEWYFHQGRSKKPNPLHLPKFLELAQSLIDNKTLFKGWVFKQRVTAKATANAIGYLIHCQKASVRNLIDMNASTSLLKHEFMHPSDKITWDFSYKSEYDRLVDIDTGELILEEEYP